MIETHLIYPIMMEGGSGSYELAVTFENQEYLDLIREENLGGRGPHFEAARKKDKQCIDDFLYVIDEQRIVCRNGGVSAYIRTKPIEGKQGLVARALLRLSKTTKSAFGVDFGSLDTRVFANHTKQGIVYDIFVNIDPSSYSRIRRACNRDVLDDVMEDNFDPIKRSRRHEDIARERRTIALFMGSLMQLYEELFKRADSDTAEGALVFHTRGYSERSSDEVDMPEYKRLMRESKKAGKMFRKIFDSEAERFEEINACEMGELREIEMVEACTFYGDIPLAMVRDLQGIEDASDIKPRLIKKNQVKPQHE
jgi:hypothetical protein